MLQYLSTLVYFEEDVHIHVDKANKRKDSCCEGWVPNQREGVPEDESWISSGLTWINLICTIILCNSHFHELGDVQSKGKSCDWDDIDEHPLSVDHGLREEDKSLKECVRGLPEIWCGTDGGDTRQYISPL